jgi:hypothetical protein
MVGRAIRTKGPPCVPLDFLRPVGTSEFHIFKILLNELQNIRSYQGALAFESFECLIVTEARIGATERAIERRQVEVSCECRLSHGYDIISLGHSGTFYDTYL